MELTEKIGLNRKEEFLQAISTYSIRDANGTIATTLHGATRLDLDWWAAREQLRIADGIYEVTDVLAQLNRQVPVFAHISKTDRNLVAFTPDKASGEADRQVTITIGRLLSKYFTVVTDAWIADKVAEHAGEVSNEIEWLEGQDIVNFYANIDRTDKTAACMSSKEFSVQPTVAYMAPGIKLARLRDSSGQTIARCMVYENGEDKRYIRPYGSQTLVKRLQRQGFKVGGWTGVVFNTVEIKLNDSIGIGMKRYALPYLDANGGTARDDYGSIVGLIDGKLTSLSTKMQEMFNRQGYQYARASSTNGYVELSNVDSTDYWVKDGFNPEITIDLVNNFAYKYWDDEAKSLKHTLRDIGSEYSEEDYKHLWRRVQNNATAQQYYVKVAQAFRHQGYWQHDTPENRAALGYEKADPELYPDQAWEADLVTVNLNGVYKRVPTRDMVYVMDEVGEMSRLFVRSLDKSYVKLHPVDGESCYVKKTGLFYLTVTSKRKVHPAWNRDLVITREGYEFPRNIQRSIRVLDKTVGKIKGEEEALFQAYCQAVAYEQLEDKLSAMGFGGALCWALRRLQVSGRILSKSTNKHLDTHTYIHNIDVTDMEDMQYVREILAGMYGLRGDDEVRSFVSNFFNIKLAEMEAVEPEVVELKTVVQEQAPVLMAA